MITIDVLQKENEQLKVRINTMLSELNGLRRAHVQYCEEASMQLQQNQDLIFGMFDQFGPTMRFSIPKFHERMKNSNLLGGMKLDEDGTLHVDITFSLDGNQSTTPQNDGKPQ